MFKSKNQGVDIYVRVSTYAINLKKANKLNYLYSTDGRIIGLEDTEGNQYTPLLSLEINEGQDGLLKSEQEIEDTLGLRIVDYPESGVSEVY